MKVWLFDREHLGKRAYARPVQVGKWYQVNTLRSELDCYGKVVAINDDGSIEVEKYFELPSRRPYASHCWFDNLPLAIAVENGGIK